MKLKSTILSLSLIALLSCSSPLEVPANREEYIDNAKSNSLLMVSPTVLNYGFVNRFDVIKMPFQMTNLNSSLYKLTSFNFGKDTKFYFENLELPMIIDSKDTPGSIQLFHVRFSSHLLGEFIDTLETNSLTNPKLIVQALVPEVFCKDVSFGSVSLQDSVSQDLLIYNYSSESIFVKDIKFNDEDGVFHCHITEDIEIPQYDESGKPGKVTIYFNSDQEKAYHTSAEITFRGNLQGKMIKNTSLLEAASF